MRTDSYSAKSSCYENAHHLRAVKLNENLELDYKVGIVSRKDHRPIPNSLKNVINSFSIRKMPCFIEKNPQKSKGNGIFVGGGYKTEKNEEK